MTSSLAHWMSVASEALLPLVLLALTLMAAWVLLLTGGFLRELLGRRATRRVLETALEHADADPRAVQATLAQLAAGRTGICPRMARALSVRGMAQADRALVDVEARVRAVLAEHALLTRLAPMCGLVATLVPMGPALTGLAEGDLDALAAHLTVAFAATVVGLVVSCLSYGMGVVRRQWSLRDLADLELLLLRLMPPDDLAAPPRDAGGASGPGAAPGAPASAAEPAAPGASAALAPRSAPARAGTPC